MKPKWQLSRHLKSNQLTWVRTEKASLSEDSPITVTNKKWEGRHLCLRTNMVFFDGSDIRIRSEHIELLLEFADEVKVLNIADLPKDSIGEQCDGFIRSLKIL